VGGPLLALAVVLHPALVILPITLLFVAGFAIMRLRCPRCETPVHKSSLMLFGERFSYWSPILPRDRRCRACGAPLDVKGGSR